MVNGFLITAKNEVSEWLFGYEKLCEKVDLLKENSIFTNVKIQQFVDGVLKKEFIYNYDGNFWFDNENKSFLYESLFF